MQTKLLAVSVTAIALLATGCAGEWSSSAYAPADYKSKYKKITAKCEKSGGHGGKYVISYISPEAYDAFTQGKVLPKGAVLIKEGYTDSGCSEIEKHWTMKKTAESDPPVIGNWKWQQLDEYGEITDDAPSGCAGCHSGYKPDFVGTPASAAKS